VCRDDVTVDVVSRYLSDDYSSRRVDDDKRFRFVEVQSPLPDGIFYLETDQYISDIEAVIGAVVHAFVPHFETQITAFAVVVGGHRQSRESVDIQFVVQAIDVFRLRIPTDQRRIYQFLVHKLIGAVDFVPIKRINHFSVARDEPFDI
jgi:hypothetical protein